MLVQGGVILLRKYHNIRISYQSISIIDLFFCFKYLKYSQTGNVAFPFKFAIFSLVLLIFFFLHAAVFLFLSGCEAQWRNLKLLMHQITQQVVARSPKTE